MLVSITCVGTNKQTSLRVQINMLNFFSRTDHASSSDLSRQEFFIFTCIILYKYIFFKVDSRPKNCIRMTNKIEKSCSVDSQACLVFTRHYNFFLEGLLLFYYTLVVNKAKKLLPNHTKAAGSPSLI